MQMEKFNKWQKKAAAGNENFVLWQRKKGIWQMINESRIYSIDTIYLCIRSSENVAFQEYWRKGDEIRESKDIAIVEKTGQGILMVDDLGKLWGFGFAEKEQVFRMLFCYRIGQIVRIVWTDTAADSVYYAYLVNEKEANPGSLDYLFDFFDTGFGKSAGKDDVKSIYE